MSPPASPARRASAARSRIGRAGVAEAVSSYRPVGSTSPRATAIDLTTAKQSVPGARARVRAERLSAQIYTNDA
jgi:hypothetical protein